MKMLLTSFVCGISFIALGQPHGSSIDNATMRPEKFGSVREFGQISARGGDWSSGSGSGSSLGLSFFVRIENPYDVTFQCLVKHGTEDWVKQNIFKQSETNLWGVTAIRFRSVADSESTNELTYILPKEQMYKLDFNSAKKSWDLFFVKKL